jgi:hypothetical protein
MAAKLRVASAAMGATIVVEAAVIPAAMVAAIPMMPSVIMVTKVRGGAIRHARVIDDHGYPEIYADTHLTGFGVGGRQQRDSQGCGSG